MCEDIDFIFMIDADQITMYKFFFFSFETIEIEVYQFINVIEIFSIAVTNNRKLTKNLQKFKKTEHLQYVVHVMQQAESF